MKVKVSRKAYFNAAHRLYRPDWSFEKMKPFLGNATIPTIMATIMN